MGVQIVGIIDRNGGLIREEGFTFTEIRELFLNRKGNQLIAPGMIPFAEINKNIWSIPAEIFVPAAASRLVTAEQVVELLSSGCEVIACGANVAFADKEIFFGPTGELADSKLSVLPDFISNCGMARVFAYLMQNDIEYSDRGIFSDVSATIRQALMKTHALSNSKTHIAKTAFEIALRQLS
jgi:glutamate dehydrogenase/leucine dehydrogenase